MARGVAICTTETDVARHHERQIELNSRKCIEPMMFAADRITDVELQAGRAATVATAAAEQGIKATAAIRRRQSLR